MALNIVGELFIDGAWTSKAGYSDRGGWTFETGPDVETSYRPSKIGVTWANDDQEMDPSNPSSSLYGKIGRNTKVRLRVNSLTLTQAEASQWEPESTVEYTPTNNRGAAWVSMTAEGLFRRLGKWTDTLQSVMTRYITGAPGLILWAPLEEPAGATRPSQGIGNAPTPIATGTFSFGEDGPFGAASALKMGTGGYIDISTKGSSSGNWTVSFAMKLPVVPVSGIGYPVLSILDSGVRQWDLNFNSGSITLDVNSFLGGNHLNWIVSYGTPPNRWTWYTLTVTTSGSTVSVNLATYAQSDAVGFFAGTSFTSSFGAGRVLKLFCSQNSANNDALYSHWTVQPSNSVYLQGLNANRIFNSYPNELAGARFVRLLQEQGLTAYVGGDGAKMMPLGPQRTGTLLDLLSECVSSEGGIVYDEPLDIALTMRSREDISARTPALALTASQVKYPLKKVIDDSGLANVVTVSNADGSMAVASLDSGPISQLAPPNGIGLVKFDLDINMGNVGGLQNRAGYELAKRSSDRPRYRQLKVDLFANPTLANTVTGMRPGDWISVAGIAPDTIYLRAISWTRSGDAVRDEVTFNCLPAEPMQIAVIDNAAHRTDSSSTVLNAAITSTATTVVLKTANPVEVWDTAGGYDLMIAGERIGVPAAGMGAASGTAPNILQTITGAVRSKNGVVKAQVINAEVHVADPVRIGL